MQIQKEKDEKFELEGTYQLKEEGLVKDSKVLFKLDNEQMMQYPDTIAIKNEVTIKNNQVASAKLKFNQYYVTYDMANKENPIFISTKAYK